MQDVENNFDKSKASGTPMRWFRMYSEFATDPKVQMLSEADQRRFLMLLCLRCSNGDVTLQDAECAFQMRISEAEYAQTKAVLVARGLIDETNQPTAWGKRQYLSDMSATRVQKHRNKRKNAGLKSQDYIHPRVRKEVFDRDANACVYCSSDDDLCIDHKVPTIRGGNNQPDNLQTACRTCNADKRNMTHDEYLNWNGRVTLLKRPQRTESETDSEKRSEQAAAPTLEPARPDPGIAALPTGLGDLHDRLVNACNGSLDNPANCLGLLSMATPQMWLERGADLERDVIPTLEAAGKKYHGKRIRDWNYFTGMVADAVEKRKAVMPKGTGSAPKESARARRAKIFEKLQQEGRA